MEEPISLGFHAIYSVEGNKGLKSVVETAHAMNVIAPTWFSITDETGAFVSLASPDYVEEAHEMGLKVWGVVKDFEYKVDMYPVLSSASNRKSLITNLVNQAVTLGIDGINIDFETIREEESIHYIQFLRELSIKCRANSLVLSVDNYPSNSGNQYLDFAEQGVIADYLIIMGYDEHWAGSKDPGSTASLSFSTNSIINIISKVSKDKVVLALPFYTRLWKESEGEVTDESVVISEIEETAKKLGMISIWDEELGQHYASVEGEDASYYMWIEDDKSLERKMQMILEKDIAGIAVWSLGFEDITTWDMLETYIKQMP